MSVTFIHLGLFCCTVDVASSHIIAATSKSKQMMHDIRPASLH